MIFLFDYFYFITLIKVTRLRKLMTRKENQLKGCGKVAALPGSGTDYIPILSRWFLSEAPMDAHFLGTNRKYVLDFFY